MMMGVSEYLDAQKQGKKVYRSCVSKGEYPYLPVLDDILTHEDVEQEQDLGLVQIPLDQIVGTATAGRTSAFANNFMPLLEYDSEFGAKWINLCISHLQEGINHAIKVYEYMNKFYVIEGNKRVSVLKYFDAVSFSAEVIRKVPKRTDDLENRIYYEFMDFYDITSVNNIWFSEEGNFKRLLDIVGESSQDKWSEEVRKDFNSVYLAFKNAYKREGGDKLPITTGDAFLAFLTVYTYKDAKKMLASEMDEKVRNVWNEFLMLSNEDTVDLVMNPVNKTKRNILSYLGVSNSNAKKTLKVGYVFDKSPETSDWNYAHELGRLYVEDVFSEQIKTITKKNINPETEGEKAINELIEEGCEIIFTTTPRLISSSLKCAVENQNVKILNCSLNTSHRYIRTYYARMYEAKFIIGVIAGALSEKNDLGYIADYPIYGNTANINAFALGAKLVNPRAKVHLYWSTKKGADVQKFIDTTGISYVSDQDMITPKWASREFGLYNSEGKKRLNMAMPVWHWGIFYKKLIQSILSGSWENTESQGNGKALNYWWGMSAGVIDVICSNNMPYSTRRLVELLKSDITKGRFSPFAGELYSQDGKLQNGKDSVMLPEEIMTIDWLADNVIGEIPTLEELEEGARSVVELQGVIEDQTI